MRQTLRYFSLVLIVYSLAASTAHAGPPFATDDPVPVDYGHWEFYLATQNEKSSDGRAGDAAQMELNYGVVPDVQLHVILPLSYDAPKGEPSHYGYGDTEVGFKYRFIHETEWIPQVAIFPLLQLTTGDASKGLGNGDPQVYLPVWFQKSWGSWTAYGGGGYGFNSGEGHQDYSFIGGLLQKQVASNVIVGAEVYRETAPDVGGRDNTAFNVGTIVDLSEQHHLLFSVGRSIDGPVEFQCYVAYQLTFDGNSLHLWDKSRH